MSFPDAAEADAVPPDGDYSRRSTRNLFGGLPPVDDWPTVDTTCLSEADRQRFQRYVNAIRFCSEGMAVAAACREFGIHRGHFYSILRTIGSLHADGRIWGLRALVPHARKRVRPKNSVSAGVSKPISPGPHALTALFAKYPELESFVTATVLKLPSAGKVQESRIPMNALHFAFLAKCQALGVTTREYPFNSKWQGYGGLRNFVSRLLAAPAARSTFLQYGLPGLQKARAGDGRMRPVFLPYERVECDGHHLDAMFCLLVPTQDGKIAPIILKRLWIIVLLDVASRAVLGYRLCWGVEPNEEDLIKAIARALSPWVPMNLEGTSFEYATGGGFPSILGADFTGCCWDELSVDGAKINLSKRVEMKLDEFVGSRVVRLARRIPDDRPFIERFFKALAHQIHRLPNTTGTGPDDIRRDNPEVVACKHFFQLEDLERLLDVQIANYNGTRHTSLFNRTPLEYLAWATHQPTYSRVSRRISEARLTRLRAVRAVVRVVGGKGRTPHVNFCYASYSCPAFRHADIAGLQIVVEADPDDGRILMAYSLDGQEIGPLQAAPPWSATPHSLLVRKLVHAENRKGRWNDKKMCDPTFSLMHDMEQRIRRKQKVPSVYLSIREHVINKKEQYMRALKDTYNDLDVAQMVARKEPPVTMPKRVEPPSRSDEDMPPLRQARIGGES